MTNHHSPITNVLFDLDGTLADTALDLAHSLNQLLQENSKPQLPFDVIRPMVSHGGVFMICKAFEISDEDPDFPELRERFLTIYESCLADKTCLFPGMPQVLEQLESDSYVWGIVTNKIERLTQPIIQALGLSDRAACIVCGDTIEHSKPHPAPMLHACQLADREPSQTLFIGDAKNDIIAGHNARMYTLIARYGYIGEQDAPEGWGADGLINSPLEILDWLAERR